MTRPDEIAALAACKTPLSHHVTSFWNLLKTETVHLSVNIRRVIGHDAPAGATVYYDCSTFSDEVAKELVRLSATPTPPSADVADAPGDPAIAIPAKECLLTDDRDHVFVRASVVRALIQSAAHGGGTKSDGEAINDAALRASDGRTTAADASPSSRPPSDPAQEPEAVAWQRRLKAVDQPWSSWMQCSFEQAEYARQHGHPQDYAMLRAEVRPLYTHPVSLDREAIARIIDPEAKFDDIDGVKWSIADIERRNLARQKVDDILAKIEGRT